MKIYSIYWLLFQGILFLTSIFGLHLPSMEGDTFLLRYNPVGEQKFNWRESENGVWLNFGPPEIFSFFAGTKEKMAEWQVRKEAPEKIFLEEITQNKATIRIEGKQFEPKNIRVFSSTGELIAANRSPDYKIIPYPEYPVKIGETWYGSFVSRKCHGQTFFYCSERIKGFEIPFIKLLSGGYDYRPVSNLLLAKVFLSLRLLNEKDGFFEGIQNYGFFLFYYLDGFKSRLQIEISETTARRER